MIALSYVIGQATQTRIGWLFLFLIPKFTAMQLEQLVEKFRNKDMSAFETLYGMYDENI